MAEIYRVHLINFIRKMTVTTVFFMAPLHLLRLGFDGVSIGLVTAAFASGPILFSFPTGWVNDRFSRKKVILAALLVTAPLFLLIGIVRSLPLMAVLFLSLGVANVALDVSINSLYLKDEREPDLNKKYGTYIFWISLGPPAGLCAGALLTRFFDFRAMLGVFAVGTALSALALRGRFREEEFELIRIRDYKFDILNRKALMFSALLFFVALHWGTEGTVYGPFLRRRFGLDDPGVALYISGAYLALALASFLISRLKYNPGLNRRLFLLGMALSGLGLVLMVQDDVRLSFFFRFVHEGGDGLMGALTILYISRLFGKRTIGGSAGILTALQTSGHIIGSVAFSWLGFHAGLSVPFLLAGFLLVANAAFGIAAVPKEKQAVLVPTPALFGLESRP